MSFPTLLAHLELGRSNASLLKITGDLAELAGAGVIGAIACQPIQMLYGDGFIAGEVIEQDRAEIAADLEKAEAEFKAALHGRARALDWRSLVTFDPLCDFFVRQARCADLIVTEPGAPGAMFDASRHVQLADLVLRAGRPVLVAPQQARGLSLKRALIGWKDTRETRRAVLDAIPLLQKAASVTVMEIARPDALEAAQGRLADVVRWLSQHDVAAAAEAVAARGEDSTRLRDFAAELGADLIVAGAYGHSRMREWVLGGVTQDLLLHGERCALLSH